MSYEEALIAIISDDTETIRKYLQSQGNRPDFWSDYKLLIEALKYNRESIALQILENGCQVNKPIQSNSPLHIAIMKRCGLSVIEKLLKQGANVTRKNRKGQTPLHLAFDNDLDDSVVDLLLHYAMRFDAINVANKQGLTFLHIACTRPSLTIVQKIVEHRGMNVNSWVSLDAELDYAGYTPLHFAVEYERLEIVEFLLASGADIYASDIEGSTPLHLALTHRCNDIIDLLLTYDGQQQNSVNRFGLSHFMAACAGSDPSIVNEFIKNASSSLISMITAKVNPDNSEYYPNTGYTPLHFAAEFGRIVTIRLLLELNVDCCAMNLQGRSAFNLAVRNHHVAASDLIEKYCNEKLKRLMMEEDIIVTPFEYQSVGMELDCQPNNEPAFTSNNQSSNETIENDSEQFFFPVCDEDLEIYILEGTELVSLKEIQTAFLRDFDLESIVNQIDVHEV